MVLSSPTGQLKPELHEEERKLHGAKRQRGLEVVGAYDQQQGKANHQRHLQQ